MVGIFLAPNIDEHDQGQLFIARVPDHHNYVVIRLIDREHRTLVNGALQVSIVRRNRIRSRNSKRQPSSLAQWLDTRILALTVMAGNGSQEPHSPGI